MDKDTNKMLFDLNKKVVEIAKIITQVKPLPY